MVKDDVEKKKQLWANDGIDGGPSSMSILLDWLTTEGNYSRWKGSETQKGISTWLGLKGGVKKETLCTEICNLIKNAGIMTRNNADIRTKIGSIEQAFRKAADFLEHTGSKS